MNAFALLHSLSVHPAIGRIAIIIAVLILYPDAFFFKIRLKTIFLSERNGVGSEGVGSLNALGRRRGSVETEEGLKAANRNSLFLKSAPETRARGHSFSNKT